VADFFDKEEVARRYYPEVAELALSVTGASEAFVFDHLVRQRQPGTPQAFGRVQGQRPGAAGRVHCDFTAASAQRRLMLELGPRTADVQRYAIFNLWRSVLHPVLDAPLAMATPAASHPRTWSPATSSTPSVPGKFISYSTIPLMHGPTSRP
jgi:hypothetical protein